METPHRKSKGNVMNGSLWNRDYVEEVYQASSVIGNFVARGNGEAITISHDITINGSTLSLAEGCAAIIAEIGETPIIKSDENSFVAVEAQHIIVVVAANDRHRYDEYNIGGPRNELNTEKSIASFKVTMVGSREMIGKFLSGFQAAYKHHKYAQIKWWFEGTSGAQSTTTYIENPNTQIRPEFYPDLKDPAAYIKRYLESDAAILLAAGPPGTGKTTLLRHMIYENNLTAAVVYDERLMAKDQIFQNFLFGKDDDILIIEDADTILTSRENDDNKLMSRFLNISDGLIKLPNKKLVFTTNISDFGRIDPALMRPGRCFDVLHTRPLNLEEAQAAAKVANLPIPMERGEYTVAELFNQGKRVTGRKAGFLGRG